MMGVLQAVFDNPILVRELRRRMRGKALVYAMIGYIGIVALVAIIIMIGMTPGAGLELADANRTESFVDRIVEAGRTLFAWITGLQFLLVLIIAPTITAGMTTAEKERKTFEFLQVTTIRPWAYVLGCFLSTVFYVSLALLCALPPLCVCFLYGGISPGDVVQMFLLLLAGSVVLSAFGLYISSVRERTRSAQGIVVLVIFALLFFGMGLSRTYLFVFGSGAGAAGTVGAKGIYLLGLGIPVPVLIALATAFASGVLLLMAARKLYNAEDRAFNYWQFGALAIIVLGALLLVQSSGYNGEMLAFAFAGLSSLLLVGAALTFAVGMMEVGDERWHMKRNIKLLRHVDESLLFLGGFALVWAYAVHLWGELSAVAAPTTAAAATGGLPSGFIDAYTWAGLSSFVLFACFGRWATGRFFTRMLAGRATLALIAILWCALPAIGYLLSAISSSLEGLGPFLGRFSPVFIAAEYLSDSAGTRVAEYTRASGLDGPARITSIFAVTLGVVFFVIGELHRRRWFARFEPHYEMPEG